MGVDITGIGSIFDFGSAVINKIWPDAADAEKAKLAMLELQQKGAFKELEMNLELAKGQLAVNVEEAKNPSVFVSGARPAAMWVCVFGLFYSFIMQPLLSWVSLMYQKPVPPDLDTVVLVELLAGLLGLSGLRSWEKGQGVARK